MGPLWPCHDITQEGCLAWCLEGMLIPCIPSPFSVFTGVGQTVGLKASEGSLHAMGRPPKDCALQDLMVVSKA